MFRCVISDRAGTVGERDGKFGAGDAAASGANRGATSNFGVVVTVSAGLVDVVKTRAGIDHAHAAANATTDNRAMDFRRMAILCPLAVDLKKQQVLEPD
jgi:hypothetical protein